MVQLRTLRMRPGFGGVSGAFWSERSESRFSPPLWTLFSGICKERIQMDANCFSVWKEPVKPCKPA